MTFMQQVDPTRAFSAAASISFVVESIELRFILSANVVLMLLNQYDFFFFSTMDTVVLCYVMSSYDFGFWFLV